MHNINNIVITNSKILPLLKTINSALQIHENTTDFTVKSMGNDIQIVDLSAEEYQQEKINSLVRQYNYLLSELNDWKNNEINNIKTNK